MRDRNNTLGSCMFMQCSGSRPLVGDLLFMFITSNKQEKRHNATAEAGLLNTVLTSQQKQEVKEATRGSPQVSKCQRAELP